MAQFNVWIEGYSATGESQRAFQLINPTSDNGAWEADSFKEACKTALITLEWDMRYYNGKGGNTYWACGFFDNEAAARASFG